VPSPKIGVLGTSSLVGGCLLSSLTERGFSAVAFSRKQQIGKQGGAVDWRQLPMPGTQSLDVTHPIGDWICVAPIWVLPDYFALLEASGARRVVALSSTSR